MSTVLKSLSWKLRPPHLPWFAVEREDLLRRLDGAFATPLTLVAAPPGYGKSVLLAQWAAGRTEHAIGWLRIEPSDNDPHRFAAHLVAALHRLDPSFDTDLLDVLEPGGSRMGDRFVDAVLAVAEDMSEAVLIIEDLDLLTNAGLLSDVGLLVGHLPPPLHLVISARGDPAISLQRNRLRDELVEVRAADLQLLPEEAAELIRRLGRLELGAHHLERLLSRTGGWPLGVQQVALALRAEANPVSFLEALSAEDRHLADYLVDEVLARETQEVRQFLLDTSVLESLSAPLCNHVLGRRDSGRLLSWLHGRDLFVTATEDEGWFRVLRLFRDLLRLHLRNTDPGREGTLLRAAADWYEAQGQPAEAGMYLVRVQAWEALADLAVRHGFAMYERGEVAAALDWLAALPARVGGRGDVRLAQGFLMGVGGEPVRAEERLAVVATDPTVTAGERVVAHAFRAMLVSCCVAPVDALASADLAMRTLRADTALVLPEVLGITNRESLLTACTASRGRALLYQGRLREAEAVLRDALASIGAAFPPVLRVGLEGSLAMAQVWGGQLCDGTRSAQRALRAAAEVGLEKHVSAAEAYLALAYVARERGEEETAASWLDEAEWRARRNNRHVLTAALAAERAALSLARREAQAGLDLLSRHAASGLPDPPQQIAARIVALRSRLHLSLGDTARARQALRAAPAPPSAEPRSVALQIAIAERSWPTARRLLATWPEDPTPFERLVRDLWSAMLEHLSGSRARGTEQMVAVLTEAEPETYRRLFWDAGPAVLSLVRDIYHAAPSSYLRSLVEGGRPAPLATSSWTLLEPLSERELLVLHYLPSRLSNAEIAGQLYVSLNTLKTHLKHVYRKLGVSSRRDAVKAGEQLGLV